MNRQRTSLRLPGYEYSKNGLYFVTFVTYNREKFFGNIRNGFMCLNEYGAMAYNRVYWLEEQYPYVKIHAFVIMPDHVHILLEIKATGRETMKVKTLMSLVGAYKSTTAARIREAGLRNFRWQASFHEWILRKSWNPANFNRYILRNPANYLKRKKQNSRKG